MKVQDLVLISIDYRTLVVWGKNVLSDIKNRLLVADGERGWRRGGLGVWKEQMQTTIYRMNEQQGPTCMAQETMFNIL